MSNDEVKQKRKLKRGRGTSISSSRQPSEDQHRYASYIRPRRPSLPDSESFDSPDNSINSVLDLDVLTHTLYEEEDEYLRSAIPGKRPRLFVPENETQKELLPLTIFRPDSGVPFRARTVLNTQSLILACQQFSRPPKPSSSSIRSLTIADPLLVRDKVDTYKSFPVGYLCNIESVDDDKDLFSLNFASHAVPIVAPNSEEIDEKEKPKPNVWRSLCFGLSPHYPSHPRARVCVTSVAEVTHLTRTQSFIRANANANIPKVLYFETTAASMEQTRRECAISHNKRVAPSSTQEFVTKLLSVGAQVGTKVKEERGKEKETEPKVKHSLNSIASIVNEMDVDVNETNALFQKETQRDQQNIPSEKENLNTSTEKETEPKLTPIQKYSLAKFCTTLSSAYSTPIMSVLTHSLTDAKTRANKGDDPLSMVSVSRANELLNVLTRHPHSVHFMAPVDPLRLGVPDYFKVIKTPMDLGTVRKNIDTHKYNTFAQAVTDIRLVFENALKFNPSGDTVHTAAGDLMRLFESRLAFIVAQSSPDGTHSLKDLRRDLHNIEKELAALRPNARNTPFNVSARVSVPKKSRPHSSGVHSHSHTHTRSHHSHTNPHSHGRLSSMSTTTKSSAEEKAKRLQILYNKISSLPPDKLQDVIKIAQESVQLEQDGELELDLEQLDEQTLKALERFVRNNTYEDYGEKKPMLLEGDFEMDDVPHEPLLPPRVIAQEKPSILDSAEVLTPPIVDTDTKHDPVLIDETIALPHIEPKQFSVDSRVWAADFGDETDVLPSNGPQNMLTEHSDVLMEKDDRANAEASEGTQEPREQLDSFHKFSSESKLKQIRQADRTAAAARQAARSEEERTRAQESAKADADAHAAKEAEEAQRAREEREKHLDALRSSELQHAEETEKMLDDFFP